MKFVVPCVLCGEEQLFCQVRNSSQRREPMNAHKMWIAVAVVAVLVLLAGGAGALAGQTEPEAIVAAGINYQGRLTDPGGAALTGTFPMRFRVYDDPGAGTLLWDSGPMSIDVDHGLFNVELAVDPAAFNGQALWLQIYVNFETLTPRQELLPAPYALSLRPGARIVGDIPSGWDVELFQLSNLATGGALRATSATGTAVHGYSTNGFGVAGYSYDSYAIYGYDGGSQQARGYAGYFQSDNGIGVYGHSSALSTAANVYAPGVYGRSANGVGVYGVGDNVASGVGGYFEGRSGVRAQSSDGYAGTFISGQYRGLYAESLDGWYDAYFAGIGGIYSAGGYWSKQADRLLVVNGGDETLEPGDVVALAGVVESPVGGEPLLAVCKADAAHASAVVGVVMQAMRLEMKEVEPGARESLDIQPVEGDVPPQGYLAIVTGGLALAVKVDAPAGGLQIGDLLTVSSVAGRAQKAGAGMESAGAILGKVAGPVDAETGTVPVFIALR
jgi:hypothetical protein